MRRFRHQAVLAACLLLLIPFGLPAFAQSVEETSLRVQVEGSALPELPDNVVARLSTDLGEPIAGALIDFWAEVEILGTRTALLGTAITDATGVARVPISPRRPDYRIRATFAGNELYAPVETAVVLSFPAERVEPVEISAPASPLATLRTVMPRAMGIVVALLWIFFAVAVFYVVKTIHRHSASSTTQPTLDNQ